MTDILLLEVLLVADVEGVCAPAADLGVRAAFVDEDRE